MQQSSGYGRAMVVTGVLLGIIGLGVVAVGVFFAMDASSADGSVAEGAAGRALVAAVLPGIGGVLAGIGWPLFLLGLVVSGVHASLVEQTKALVRARG